MKTKLLSMARDNWKSDYSEKWENRAMQLKWARAVHFLGDRWCLAKVWTRQEIESERLTKHTCIKWECTFRKTA